jgi:hypothetical protein
MDHWAAMTAAYRLSLKCLFIVSFIYVDIVITRRNCDVSTIEGKFYICYYKIWINPSRIHSKGIGLHESNRTILRISMILYYMISVLYPSKNGNYSTVSTTMIVLYIWLWSNCDTTQNSLNHGIWSCFYHPSIGSGLVWRIRKYLPSTKIAYNYHTIL